jgi:aldehyde dehydrogenase (NAD+)
LSTAVEPTFDHRRAAIDALAPAAAHIDGEWSAVDGAEYSHTDPATGAVLRSWALAGPGDVDRAVDSAARAQVRWAALSPAERRDRLLALAAEMSVHAGTLAALVSLEMGMPLRASQAGVHAAAEWFRHYAGYADKIEGAVPSVGRPGAGLDYTRLSPYGVVAAVIPWNGPVMALALKVAPALAAGNAVVLKPSEIAPSAALFFGSLVAGAGLPRGVVNVVAGGADVGAALCAHPAVGLISFTGGAAAGRAVSEAAAVRHVPSVLELGGKSASLVFADADIEKTAKLSAVLGIAQNSGQGCFLPTRLLVQRSSYDRTLDAVVAAAGRFRLGSPFDPATNMGPIVDARSRDRILGVIAAARQRGDGRLVHGGGRATGELAGGNFIEPTIFADVDPGSPLAQDEVFGPVLSVIAFDDEAEAIEIANNSRYGLAGYIWTSDLGRAHRVAEALDVGYVSVNGMAALPPGAPFGGWKASGHGVEGGRGGLMEYLRVKNVHVQW